MASQPTVSHHRTVMTSAGLVERDKRSVWAYYRIVPDALASLASLFAAQATVKIPA